MKFNLIGFFIATILPTMANAAPFVGIYQTIDDETNAPKSVVALYEYKDGDDMNLAGRIVALYGTDGKISETLSNPVRVAEKVKGSPKMVGLDIIWDMEWDNDDNEYSNGKIMDPKSGKVYSSVMWQEKPEVLNVRGKIGPFGRTQKWNVLDTTKLPNDLQNLDTTTWTPIIKK